MPVLAILTIALQVGLAVHCVKTGRDRQWLYLIFFLPLIGGLVYFATQVLPDLRANRTVRQASSGLARAVDPHAELRLRKEQLEMSDSVDNRLRLADECMEADFPGEAETLYASCLKGPQEDNPNLLIKVAFAQFAQDKFADTKTTLERVVETDPDFKSTAGHLLYARALEALDDPGVAEEYEALLHTFPGEEARVRYAQWLGHKGCEERATELYREVLARSRHSPKYYRQAQKHWIGIAEQHAH